MAVRVGVVADKGGVGRTDFVRLLAERFAKMGLTVACVDMDYQAILSRRMGYEMYGADVDLTNSSALMRREVREGGAASLWQPCRWQTPWAGRIRIIPSHEDLSTVESEPRVGNPTGRLERALSGADDDAHITLLDTRPDMGISTQAVWATCDYLIGVCAALRDDAEGLLRTIARALALAPDLGNEELQVAGAVVNEYSDRSDVQTANRELLRKGLASFDPPIRVFDQALPSRTFIKYSASTDVPLETYLAGNTLEMKSKREEVDDFMTRLANEILEAIGVRD